MNQGKQWLQKLTPVMVLLFLSFAQSGCAQNNYPNEDTYSNNDNSGNYDNNDDALIQPQQNVDYNTFQNELSPYGNWMNYPGYGNVWVCNDAGFRPYYSGGHWAYTRFGWTWVSDYNWGWAPFHYGRWAFDNAYGWFWVPGYTWGPAWVSWRTGGDVYGWAPLSPGLEIGVNVGIGIPADNWVFLPHRYMGYRSLNSYYVNRQQNVTIIRNTTVINNTNVYNNNRFVTGPDRQEVERYSGQRIQQQNIYVSTQRGVSRQDRNGIHLYNPGANNNVNSNRAGNGNNRYNNNQQPNTAVHDNVRPQPFGRQPAQNSVQPQQQNGQQQIQRGQQNGNNQFQNNQQRAQEMQNNRMQQQNEPARQQQNDQRQQQMQQQRQQMINERSEQIQQQQVDQRRQQMESQRGQMEQQRQQQMQQQRQQDMQRQQMQQQRQQQFQQQPRQQINRSSNQPAPQQHNIGGNRRRDE